MVPVGARRRGAAGDGQVLLTREHPRPIVSSSEAENPGAMSMVAQAPGGANRETGRAAHVCGAGSALVEHAGSLIPRRHAMFATIRRYTATETIPQKDIQEFRHLISDGFLPMVKDIGPVTYLPTRYN